MKTRYKRTVSIKEVIKAHRHMMLYFDAIRKSIDAIKELKLINQNN